VPSSIAPGICYGRLDVGVDASRAGEVSALAADPRLRGAVRVWTSPARRCLVVAEAVAGELRVDLTPDARLWELDFGQWEAVAWDAVDRAALDRWAADPKAFAPPGGESGAVLVARVRAFHEELCREARDCVVVAHGGSLKVLAPLLQGRPVDLLAPAQPMGSVVVIDAFPP
jgi:alpha-ribazole phosphatase